MSSSEPIRHELLSACGVEHGFGVRDAEPPAGLLRPRQVHGIAVARATGAGELDREEADAVLSTQPGAAVAIVTADCVPILAAAREGHAVVAIHAGWRGLAAGVVGRGIAALRAAAPASSLVAVVGPRIGPCCYEVDAPVFDALRQRFDADLDAAVESTRPGHGRLDLAALAQRDLIDQGLTDATVAVLSDACTRCDAERFHSYRRDGVAAGRLIHHVAPAGAPDR